ncbi:molecular chaperone GroES [Parcubacteria bacterium SG8_24]|nr:MAG: molecular chaperone GroES [Parcubacteria bacterium SG8_24]
MQVKPLSDRVLVKPLDESETTKSGIVIPDTVEKERPEKGEVIAVGPGKMLENGSRSEMSIQPGDKVVFKKYGPDEIKVDGQELLILEESDILAVLG